MNQDLKQMSAEGKADFLRLTAPEYKLYARLSENLPHWMRMFFKLDKAVKEGKFDLPLNDRGLPF